MKIRFAQKEDIEQIIELCKAHAKYEKANYSKVDKAELLFNYLFNQHDILSCLVVVKQSRVVGYATFMKQFSTWEAKYYLYLDCLFLRSEVRGKGIGKKMMLQIKEIAEQKKCSWIEWQTPIFNDKAIKFYHNLGAKSKLKTRFFWNKKKPAENRVDVSVRNN